MQEDILEVNKLAVTPPEEAAKNINRSKLFDIGPDNYVELKSQLEPEAISYEYPPTAEAATAEYMKLSTQNASLMKPESDIFDYLSRQGKYIYHTATDVADTNKELTDIYKKGLDSPKGLNDFDRELATNLKAQQSRQAQENFGITGTVEKLPAQVVGIAGDIFKGVKNNAETIAGFTSVGAGVGFLAPVPGGTLAGAGKGFSVGLTVSMFKQGYEDTSAQVYGELDSNKELNASHEEKQNIARGVGIVGGAAFAGASLALRGSPFLNKLLPQNVGAYLISKPALRAAFDVLGNATRSATVGGIGSGATEFAKIVGEEIAKTDGSEASFENVIYALADKEKLKRVGTATTEGALGLGAFSLVAGGVTYNKARKNYVDINNKVSSMLGPDQTIVVRDGVMSVERKSGLPDMAFNQEVPRKPSPAEVHVNDSIKVLKTQDALVDMGKAISATKMKNLAPSEITAFNKILFNQTGSMKFWLNEEDIPKIAKNPEDEKKLRKMMELDPSGLLASQISGMSSTNPHTFLDIQHEWPNASDYFRLHPAGPNPNEARNLLERQKEADVARQNVLSNLGVDGSITPEQDAQIQQALSSVHEATQTFTESEYYDRPTFTPAIEGALSDARVENYNLAQTKTRAAVAEILKQNIDEDFESTINKSIGITSKNEIKIQLAEHDAALTLINKFTGKIKTPETKELRKKHEEKGTFSPYAIDPKYLPEEMRDAITSDPNLLKRKVFVAGGLSPNEAAALMGVDSGESLLKFLANSPDKKDIIARREQLNVELKSDLEEIYRPKKELATTEAFTNLSKAHHEEMKFMKEKEWSQTKAGIKTIALPLPSIPEINLKAKDIVANTPIKDLNVRQFVVGEKRNQAKAVDHILKNEVEQAFKAKENAIFSSELSKESIIMKTKIAKAQKRLKRINTPETQAILKEADGQGKKYYSGPVNEILDVFNLDLSRKGLAERGSFNKYVEQQIQLGNTDISIPEKFNEVRESITEYSGEQFVALVDKIDNIIHQAKMKNKLYNKFKELEMIQTEEAIVTKVGLHLESHPDFDLNRVSGVPGETLDTGELAKSLWQTTTTFIDNAQLLALTADQEKPNGIVTEVFIKPVRKAQYNETDRNSALVDHINKNIEAYGKKEFNELWTDMIYIPEYADYPDLGNGWTPKRSLLMDIAYMGDPYTLAKISNYKKTNSEERMTLDVMKKVIERELTLKDAKLAQTLFLDSFKGKIRDESAALHLETTGQEPDMVEGSPFELFGVMFDGGYMPAKYRYTSDDVKIGRHLEDMSKKAAVLMGEEDGKLYGQLAAASMTNQGRLADRTGSTRPLDRNTNGFIHSHQEINHDLSFRKVGIDNLKLLKNPIMAKNLKAVLGEAEFKVFYNSMIEVVGNVKEMNKNYYGDQQRVAETIVTFFRTNQAFTLLAGSISSMVIQPASLVNAATRMGSSGASYMTKAAAVLGSNLHNHKMISEFLEKLNPALKHHADGIDESLIKSVFDGVLPIDAVVLKKYKRTGKALSTLKRGGDFYMNFLMSGMSIADQEIKKVVTYASYMQFIEGKAEGYPKERLDKMSKEQIFQGAIDYIDQISKSSLTASSKFDKTTFEKLTAFKAVNLFFTDTRSQINGMMALGRKTKWGGKKAYEGAKEGDFKKAKEGAGQAAGAFVTAILATGTYQLIGDIIRGNDNPTKHVLDVKSDEDLDEFLNNTLRYFTLAAPTIFAEGTPIVKDMLFAYRYGKKSSRSDYRNVSYPSVKMVSDFTTGVSGLTDMLEMALEGESIKASYGYLSKEQKKAMLFSAGYLTRYVPANGIYKAQKIIESEPVQNPTEYIKDESKRLNDAINNYIKLFGKKPEAQDFIEDLKQVQKEIIPQYTNDVREVIPENFNEQAKAILSNGDWTKFNPTTKAAGVYQFTEAQWNDLKNAHPELGLTENGRVSKDPAQQEKAMEWETKNNARGFVLYDIPVDTKNLLGAHKFGFDNYTAIYGAKDSESLSKVLGDNSKDPIFTDFKTVKDVKDYLSKQVQGRGPASEREGWGHSIVNGEEIWTPPTGYKGPNKTTQESIEDIVAEGKNIGAKISKQFPNIYLDPDGQPMTVDMVLDDEMFKGQKGTNYITKQQAEDYENETGKSIDGSSET